MSLDNDVNSSTAEINPAAKSDQLRAKAALERLAFLHPKLIDLGLERSFDLLARLQNPHHNLPPVIHVAGTNGKGSTIAFLRAMAEAAGLSTHTYTSPHLCRFNERIRLAGRLIDDAALADLLEEVETANGTANVTFFEVTTAAAMLNFARVPADLLLLETGLGGTLDSTNVVDKPLATIITPIARDHEHFLGNDIGEIALQKAGIMRPGIACFSAQQTSEVGAVLAAHAEQIKAPFYQAGIDFELSTSPNNARENTSQIIIDGQVITLPAPSLPGLHQHQNAGLAAIAMRYALGSMGRGENVIAVNDILAKGTANAVWPGRVQQLKSGHLAEHWPDNQIWLDGAHNAHGAAALAATLPVIHKGKWNIICGALNTRDPAEFLAPLAGFAAKVRCLHIPGQDASLSADAMTSAATNLELDAAAATHIEGALDSLDPAHPVIICGSLYLAGHILVQNKTLPD